MISNNFLTACVSPHAYVTNQYDGTINIINVETDTIQTIGGFSNLRVVVISPDGLYAYVGSDDGNIRVIDTRTNTVLPVVILVNQPSALAITRDGAYIYAASNDDTVNVISTATYAQVDSISGDFSNIQDLVATPDGNFIYVTDSGNNNVFVIRISDNTVVDTITGFSEPLGISISPDGAYVYVTNNSNGTLSVIRTSDNTITQVVGGFTNPRYGAVTPDGAFLYVSSLGDNRVVVLRTSDYTEVDSISVVRPVALAVTPDGSAIYIARNQEAILKYRTSDRVLLSTTEGLASPSNISMALTDPPSDHICVFSSRDCRLFQSDVYVEVKWAASAGSPEAYLIFRNRDLTDLIGEVAPNVLHFREHNVKKHHVYTYYVAAQYADGFLSTVGNVEITP